MKMDYNLNAKQHITGSFYWDDYPRINADQGGVWSPRPLMAGRWPTLTGTTPRRRAPA